jgi:hypothetical protein
MRRLAGNDLEAPEEYQCGLWKTMLDKGFVKHKCKAHKCGLLVRVKNG